MILDLFIFNISYHQFGMNNDNSNSIYKQYEASSIIMH